LTFNSKALYTQNNNVLYNSTVLGGKSDIAISHVCLIQGIRYFVARHDRVYYALDLIIIDDPSYLNLNYGLTNSLVAANSSGDSPASKTITDTISTLQTTITSIKEDLNNVTDPTTKGNLNTELTNAENQLKDLVDKYTKLKSSGQLTPDEEKKILSDLTALSKLIGSLKSKVTSTIANQTNKTSTPTGTGTDKEDKNDSDFWSNVEDVMKFIVDNPIPTALGLIAGAAGLYFGSSYLLSKIPPKNSPEKPPDDDNNNDGGTTTNGNPDGNDGGGGTNQILETLWKDYNDAVASGSYVDAYKIAEQIEIQKEKLDTSNTAIYTSYLNKLDGIFVLKNDFLNSAFFQNLINPNPSTTTTIATNPTTSTNPNPFDTGINLDGSLGGGTGPVTFPQPGTIPTTTTGTGGGISPTNPLNIDAELTAFGSGTDLDLFTDIEFLNALNFKNNIITAKADLINGNQIKVVTNAEAVSPQIITQLINNSNPDTGIINITSTDLTNLTDAEINNAITTSYQIKGGNVNTLGTGALAVQTGTNIYRPITSNGILSDKEVVIINGANGTTTIEIRQGGKVLDAITSSPTTVGSDVSRAIKKALVAF
jgi:hypothetical protein